MASPHTARDPVDRILQLAPSLDEETTGELKATKARLKALQQVGYEGVRQAS